MADTEYLDALKRGQKEYRRCVSHGASPWLPALDDLLFSDTKLSTEELGIVQIPSELIVGVKNRGRMSSFAANFMPVLEPDTEFAQKWQALCRAHLSEGIRDPIKAWEYMNRFYVEEGNKRVSVLKYFESPSITAQVVRILPPKTPDNELYYEFLAFYRVSRVNYLEFTRKGSYSELLTALGKQPTEIWTEEERRRFSTAFYYFRTAYQAAGGAKLQSTVGDAMLSYIRVYGYPSLRTAGGTEIRKNLTKMWDEITLNQESAPVELKLSPTEEKKGGLLSRVLPSANATVKAAFLYDRSPETSGWAHAHEAGREHVQRLFDGRIETTARFNVMEQDPAVVLEQVIAEGNTLIFATSPRLTPFCLRAAIEHPETVIMSCTLNSSHRYIRSYYARMYEAKFIIGAIAGAMTESGRLGYICDYPIFGQIAGINAFALGAQMTNPRARVYLEWSSVKGAARAEQELLEKGIHLISAQDSAGLAHGRRSSFGLSCIHGEQRELLATPVWNWGAYYEQILRGILSKTEKSDYESSTRALNYYWGMSAGVVDIVYAESLHPGTRRLADFLKESICREVCNPFLTPLRRQDGGLVGEGERTLTQEQIVSMDYLVENVEGSLPRYEELGPIGRATVDMAGVYPARAEAEGKSAP